MERRSLLKLRSASAAMLVLAGGGLGLLRSGLENGRLSASARQVFAAAVLARRMTGRKVKLA